IRGRAREHIRGHQTIPVILISQETRQAYGRTSCSPFTTSSTEKRPFPRPDELVMTDENSETAVTRKIRSAWATKNCRLTTTREQVKAEIALSTINTAEVTRIKVRIRMRNRIVRGTSSV